MVFNGIYAGATYPVSNYRNGSNCIYCNSYINLARRTQGMKRRFNQAQDIMQRLYHTKYDLDELNNIINHIEAYERIIKKFIDKRDVLAVIINKSVDSILFSDADIEKFKIQYELLDNLLWGIE
jgi:hypothetical protein